MSTERTSPGNPVRRLATRARTLAVIYLAVLFTATHIPTLPTHGFSMSDKLCHLGGYMLLTVCVLFGWELTTGVLQPKHYFAVWLVGILYGAFDEITQIPVGRTCDLNDWMADVLGIVCGLVVFRMFRGMVYRMFAPGDPLAAGGRP